MKILLIFSALSLRHHYAEDHTDIIEVCGGKFWFHVIFQYKYLLIYVLDFDFTKFNFFFQFVEPLWPIPKQWRTILTSFTMAHLVIRVTFVTKYFMPKAL